MKRTPLKRYTGLKPSGPLRHRLAKQQRVYERQRAPLVRELLAEFPLCQRCLIARSAEVHEVRTRARGGSILDPDNCRAVCSPCHQEIHAHWT